MKLLGCLTNDSASLLMDDELLNTPVNVPEKQKIFDVLYARRKKIIAELNEKVKEAVQNCLVEKVTDFSIKNVTFFSSVN